MISVLVEILFMRESCTLSHPLIVTHFIKRLNNPFLYKIVLLFFTLNLIREYINKAYVIDTITTVLVKVGSLSFILSRNTLNFHEPIYSDIVSRQIQTWTNTPSRWRGTHSVAKTLSFFRCFVCLLSFNLKRRNTACGHKVICLLATVIRS